MKRGNAPGTYILIIELPNNHTIAVGSLGKVAFEKGYYLYVGSALAGLRARLQRHLGTRKRTHWHIDYLLPHGHVREIWYHVGPERHECTWARALDNMSGIKPSSVSFGASDCHCDTHLFYSRTPPSLRAFKVELKEKVEMQKLRVAPGHSTDLSL
ncbi:MAG: GIY-YIG nuclease family protein [Chloroflexota bacterium]|nr:GIY-YIG nuclease family protein [Chloroflexota bacterium]